MNTKIIAFIIVATVLAIQVSCATRRISQFSGNDDEKLAAGMRWLMAQKSYSVLDLEARQLNLRKPVIVTGREAANVGKVVRNGRLNVWGSSDWNEQVHRQKCRLNAGHSTGLSDGTIDCPKNLPAWVRGARVETGDLARGAGNVARETYVRAVSGKRATLSGNVFKPATVMVTFRRMPHVIDMSAAIANRMYFDGLMFRCNYVASGVSLPAAGSNSKFTDCKFMQILRKAITSTARGCRNLNIHETSVHMVKTKSAPATRQAIGVNTNEPGVVFNSWWAEGCKHTMVLANGAKIRSSHWMQGAAKFEGRDSGLVITNPQPSGGVHVESCYVDNNGIELSSEAAGPAYKGYMGELYITRSDMFHSGNMVGIKPVLFYPRHARLGLRNIVIKDSAFNGNNNKALLSHAMGPALNRAAISNVVIGSMPKAFSLVRRDCNPCTLRGKSSSASSSWTVPLASARFPANFQPRRLTSFVLDSDSKGVRVTNFRVSGTNLIVSFNKAVKGSAIFELRIDTPRSNTDDAKSIILTRNLNADDDEVDSDDSAFSLHIGASLAALLALPAVGLVAVVFVAAVALAAVLALVAFVARRAVSAGASAASSKKSASLLASANMDDDDAAEDEDLDI